MRPRRVGAARILTIANNKGGVGKTTTAYYLAKELVRQHKRVLLIDLDGQANLTERCFPDLEARRATPGGFPNITDYFAGDCSLLEVVTPMGAESISIIPSDPFLTLRDYGGSGRPDIELRFVQDVQKLCLHPVAGLGGTPDWIIIDTPPAMSVFTRAGLAAAEFVLTPIRPRRSSAAGTTNVLKTVKTMNALMGTQAMVMGAVVTHADHLQVTQGFLGLELPGMFSEESVNTLSKKLVLDSEIPFDNQLETLEPGARTKGAQAYEKLAREVLDYAG